MKKFYSFIFIAFIGVIVFQWSSCKGPQPCNGVITVYDSAGVHPQANATVHLYAQINYNGLTYQGDLTANGTTNSSGQFSITIKDPCILDVRATIANCDSTALHPHYCMGHAILTFAEGQTNSVNVYVNQ
jgi:hypothetical protein